MGALEREAERFGPWVVELSDEDLPPRLFAPYLPAGDRPLLAVKIPRRIDQRRARPGMDLYDYVVVIHEEEMVVLRRVDTAVHVERWSITDLQELRVSRALLRGNLRLGLPGRRYDLPYNTISDALMRRIVDHLRARYRPAGGDRPANQEPLVPDGMLSFCFTNLCADERRRRSPSCLVAAQGTTPVRSRSRSRPWHLIHRVVDKRLLEALHFSDGVELKILTRGAPFAYRWQPVYGVETTFIPIGNVVAADWHADLGDGATVLDLRTASGQSSFVFADDNDSVGPYAAYLAQQIGSWRGSSLPSLAA
jgi:hypothetical protein